MDKIHINLAATFFSLFLILYSVSTISAQENMPIEMKKTFGGYKFKQGETPLTVAGVVETMKMNKNAYKLMKKAQSNITLETVLSGAGGFCIGYPIGTALGGGEPNWALAGVGAGLVLVTIPISQKVKKQAQEAIDIYNDSIELGYIQHKPKVNLGFTPNGIGLLVNF